MAIEEIKAKLKTSLFDPKRMGYLWVVLLLLVIGVAVSDEKDKVSTVTAILIMLFLLLSIWILVLYIKKVIGVGKNFLTVTVPHKHNKEVFKRDLLAVLSDHVITEDEEAFLKKRKEELGITDEEYMAFRKEELDHDVKPLIRDIIAKKRFSPDDEAGLLKVAANHRIMATFDDQFTKYRLLWEIENSGEYKPKAIQVDIRLSNNEECYMQIPAVWKQAKVIRQRTGYVGGSIGFRVAKGVTLRVGRAIPTYSEYEGIVPISSGVLYVTNKKLVFVGDSRSTNITMGRLADYKLFQDAIEIQKTSGKPDIFKMHEDDIQLLDALLQVI